MSDAERSEIEPLTAVLEILTPLDADHRARLLNTVETWFQGAEIVDATRTGFRPSVPKKPDPR